MSRPARRALTPILELIVLSVLIGLVPFVISYDTAIMEEGLGEESFTETLHSLLSLLAALVFAAGAVKIPACRGYLVLAATLYGMVFIRENDFLLDRIVHGFWIWPAMALAAVGGLLALRARESIRPGFVAHIETRAAGIFYVGTILLIVFSRLFGTGALWEPIMGDNYLPAFKAALQEGLELMACVLVAFGAVRSWRDGFGVR